MHTLNPIHMFQKNLISLIKQSYYPYYKKIIRYLLDWLYNEFYSKWEITGEDTMGIPIWNVYLQMEAAILFILFFFENVFWLLNLLGY